MERDNLAALVKLIMADKRIMDLIRNGTSECGDLTLIETRDLFETLPLEWRGNVCCQEVAGGSDGFLSCESAAQRGWNRIRVYQPSLNIIAKLAMGIADEPLLKILQQKLAEGAEHIELLRLCNVSGIRQDSYKKLFFGYLEKLRSFGIGISDDGMPAAEADSPTAVKICKPWEDIANSVNWQYRALTERDLLDMEKGTVINVGRKCIVTSLAVDAARRKSIQICREGEVK